MRNGRVRAALVEAPTVSGRAQSAEAFPAAGDYAGATVWCGLRPATPKGTPIIDGTPYENLWLNLGQGALGFTLALASGRLASDLVGGQPPSIPLDGFRLSGN